MDKRVTDPFDGGLADTDLGDIDVYEIATAPELAAVRGLVRDARAECERFSSSIDSDPTPDDVSLDEPRARFFLAEVDGAPIGWAGIAAAMDGACEMRQLYVRPEHRGARVGRLLADQILDAAREGGFRRLRFRGTTLTASAKVLADHLGLTPCAARAVDGSESAGRGLEMAL